MREQHPFKWRHFQAEIILLCVRWYLRYSLSYRDLEEIMLERGLHVDHTTIYRWVQQYAPELERRCRPHLKTTTDSWRVDETYIKVKKQWVYLYRAVDSQGNTLEFLLSPSRDAEAAQRFFLKTLAASHSTKPRVINVDKNAAYPVLVQKFLSSAKSSIFQILIEVKRVKAVRAFSEKIVHAVITRSILLSLKIFAPEPQSHERRLYCFRCSWLFPTCDDSGYCRASGKHQAVSAETEEALLRGTFMILAS
jgi:transposase-like protein